MQEVITEPVSPPPPPPLPAGPPPPLSNAVGANLCFLNALLQALASAPAFVDWVDDLKEAGGESDGDGGALVAAAASLFAHLAARSSPTPTPPPTSAAPLVAAARRVHAPLAAALAPGRQHDAAEAADLLTAALESAARRGGEAAPTTHTGLAAALSFGDAAQLPPPMPPPPLPRCPLHGTLVTHTLCAVCQTHAPAHISPFTCLPLPLPEVEEGTSVPLARLLHAFAAIEAVSGVECGHCSLRASVAAASSPTLGAAIAALAASTAPLPADGAVLAAGAALEWTPARRTALRRCLLARPPPVLLLHIGRVQCSRAGVVVKLRGGVGGLEGPIDARRVAAATAPPLFGGDDAPPSSSSQPPPLLYDCVAAVAHVGASPRGGHYVAYRRGGEEGEWWGVSDARVWRARAAEVEAADLTLCVCVRR